MVDAPRRHIRYASFLDTESHHFISTVLVIRILFIEGDTARREYCQYFCWKEYEQARGRYLLFWYLLPRCSQWL